MREYSTPVVVEVPASARLTDTVFERAEHDPGSVVLRRKASLAPAGARPAGREAAWQDVTARQFRDEVAALAKGFMAAGIGEGDRVALLSRTRYEWTAVDYALWAAGAVPVPVYETSSAEQTEWILSDSGARACFVETAAFAEKIGGFRDRVPCLSHVWQIDPGDALDALRAGGAAVGDEVVAERAATARATDLATIIYTSGTTGRPKGCELTHENMLSDVRNAFLGPLTMVTSVQHASTLLFLPLAHVFARIIEVGCIEGGVVLGHCGDLTALLPALASFQPTFILAVPRVFEKVYNSAEQKARSEKKGAIFGRAADVAIAYSRALDAPGGRPSFFLRAQHALFDRLVYRKLRAALGGRAQYAVSGGAALSERLS